MRSSTKPIAATFLFLAVGCTGGRGPTPTAAPPVDPAAAAPVDPAADTPAEPTADPPTDPAAEPPANPAVATTPTQPTCDSWAEWNFFESASAELVRACLQAGADVSAVVEDGHTILHRATIWADGKVTALLLEAGADVDARDDDGVTPLRLAAENNNLAAVATLLEAGSDVNARHDFTGETPLHLAAENNNLAVVATLLEAGADMDAPFYTPLHAAAYRHWAETVNVLLDAGADVNAGAGGTAGTPLVSAAWTASGAVSEAISALLEAGADVNLASASGNTPLHGAVRSRASGGAHPELLSRLLALGADPNARNGRGETPLYRAAGVGDLQAIRALVEAGADPLARTDDGASALHAAVWRRTRAREVIALLVEIGLDVNARNERGRTPLHIARIIDNFTAVRTLLELGADPDARDNAGRVADPVCYWSGWDLVAEAPAESVRGCLERGIPVHARDREGATPLAQLISAGACCADFKNVLREFVAAGADVNARDDEGRTPLHRALYGTTPPDIVTSPLLDAGADPSARDSAGLTPMHIAASGGRGPDASLLATAGADVNARDNRGRTPLHLARDPETIRTLLQLGADPAALDSAGTVADPAACARWGSEAFFTFATADIAAGCIAGGEDAHTIADGSQATALLFTAAALTPDTAVVAMLLEAGADVHAHDGFLQYTPLHHAAQSGTPQVVRALLEASADVDAWAKGSGVDWRWGWTPLHLAARSNPDPEVVSALVEAGADLHAPGEESYHHGNTPLHYAGDNPSPDVAAALLSAGANVNALSARGRTPLHEAAANASNPAVIDVLVAAGADVNALDSNGHAPLHSVARYNPRPEIATVLIAAGADVNAGRALLMALYRGGVFIGGQPRPTRRSLAVVEVLVSSGANLEHADESGLTALHMSAIWTPAAFPLLLQLGADPSAPDVSGKTPWDYALRNPSLQGLEEVRRMREEMRRGGAERQ